MRMPGHDYAAPGWHFVTLATYRKEHLFGEVKGDRIHLSEFGCVVRDEWLRTSELRHEVALDEFVIMPNHFHAIVVIREDPDRPPAVGAHGRAPRGNAAEYKGRPPRSLGSLVAGFKSSVTVRINQLRRTPNTPVWLRNYHDHIIRGEEELRRIQRYIRNNPRDWAMDPDNAQP
jgi:REP element-mobilizing transposase RayT